MMEPGQAAECALIGRRIGQVKDALPALSPAD
jgi:hypothetical protein